jgi:hypothetical protein
MRSRTSSRRERSEIGSLMERLKALEDSLDFSGPGVASVRAVPTTVALRRSPSLIRWFSLGFACSLLGGGGIAILMSLVIHTAQAKPSFGACWITEPVIQSGIMPEARQLWWKLPLAINQTGPRLARAHE